MPLVTETPGGPSLRHQFKAHEKALAEKERAQLDACRTPEERHALKAQFTQARAERARRYAAAICSEPGWEPKAGASSNGKILTAFYALLGRRARENAQKTGKPFSMADIEKVRLSRADVENLRKEFGDAEIKKAWPLLQKHIAHADFLDKSALRFMLSGEFLVYRAAIHQQRDTVEHNIEQHREQLSAKDAELLREHNRLAEKRKLTHWDKDIVVSREGVAEGHPEKVTYVSVGGRLVPVDRDPE
jgi:hypothetical protein